MTENTWQRKRTDLDYWQPTINRICQRENLPRKKFIPFATGSAAVFGTDDLVIKVYHPIDKEDCIRERESLQILAGKIDIGLPHLVAFGEVEKPYCAENIAETANSGIEPPREKSGNQQTLDYVVMSRLSGQPLTNCWKEIPKEQKENLVEKLGEVTRQMHSVTVPADSIVSVDIETFLAEQVKSAKKRQVERKLASPCVEQIDEYLAQFTFSKDGAFLHTELMRDHLLVAEKEGKWHFTGLFDFAETMALPVEYEFPSVGLFVTMGDKGLFRRFLGAYGYDASQLNFQLSRRLLAYTLLHRYANLNWYLSFKAPPKGVGELDDLARCWFSL